MTDSNDVEYSALARQVQQIEKLIADTGGNVSYLLKAFVQNAKGRLEQIKFEENRGEAARKEEKDKETAAVVAMVEREKNLTAEEKAQYGEFLKQDFFTKEDFSELKKFYADGGAWSRLSEDGKEQMSQRVWEGIRRDEFTFGELPEEVRKNESERLYQKFTGTIEAEPSIKNIPAQDRADFIREYESGNDRNVSEVLTRESIQTNVAPRKLTDEGNAVNEVEAASASQEPVAKDKINNLRIDNADALEGISLADASEVTKPDLPIAEGKARGKS